MAGSGQDTAHARDNLINLLVLAPAQHPVNTLTKFAKNLGVLVFLADNLDEATTLFRTKAPRILVTPAFSDGRATLPFVAACLASDPNLQTIFTVERDQINEAAEAMRIGVLDCLFKPFTTDRFTKTLITALRRLGRDSLELTDAINRSVSPNLTNGDPEVLDTHLPNPRTAITGSHPATTALRGAIRNVANSHDPVLLRGEAGSGLSHSARAIHTLSDLSNAPFHSLDCDALTPVNLPIDALTGPQPAVFYLDEICDLSARMQTHLVQILAKGTPPHIRLIGATCQDPDAAMRAGHLNRDLFYHLCMTQIPIPPLRERGHDVIEITREKLLQFAHSEGGGLSDLSPEVIARLLAYSWPGNLRQLVDVVRNIEVVYGRGEDRRIETFMLPPSLNPEISGREGMTPGQPLPEDLARQFQGQSLEQIERQIIDAVIADNGGSVTRAAKILKVAPSTLYRKRQAWDDTTALK